jgi:hypothetical protein
MGIRVRESTAAIPGSCHARVTVAPNARMAAVADVIVPGQTACLTGCVAVAPPVELAAPGLTGCQAHVGLVIFKSGRGKLLAGHTWRGWK